MDLIRRLTQMYADSEGAQFSEAITPSPLTLDRSEARKGQAHPPSFAQKLRRAGRIWMWTLSPFAKSATEGCLRLTDQSHLYLPATLLRSDATEGGDIPTGFDCGRYGD